MQSALLAAARAAETVLLRDLRRLVEMESPSNDKAAVDRANECAAAWAVAMGGQVRRHRQRTFGDVLELRFGGPRRRGGPAAAQRKPALILGHLDTVWPVGTLAAMPWREADGKIFGPGILDMKCGVAMAFAALRMLQAEGVLPPVTLLLNSDEEVGSPISRPITEKLAAAHGAVFVVEPAQGLAYKTARKGVGHYSLEVRGVAAHAGVDFGAGHSAILEMARLTQRIAGLTDLARGTTVNVGTVRGGTLSNVVAAECRAEIDVRIVRPSDGVRLERRLRALRTADRGCTMTLSGGINRPPMERRAGTAALFRRAAKLAAEMGLALAEASTGGGSDGNFTAALGVPTLDGMGAVGSGAHAVQEHIVRAHLAERTALLAGMLAGV